MKNKKRELQAVFFDTKEKTVKIVHFEDELDEIYRLLDCTAIDIVQRYVGDMKVDIICDDEGQIRENPVISAINREKEVMFVQNLLICGPVGQ